MRSTTSTPKGKSMYLTTPKGNTSMSSTPRGKSMTQSVKIESLISLKDEDGHENYKNDYNYLDQSFNPYQVPYGALEIYKISQNTLLNLSTKDSRTIRIRMSNKDFAKEALEKIINFVEPQSYDQIFANIYYNSIPNNSSRRRNIVSLQQIITQDFERQNKLILAKSQKPKEETLQHEFLEFNPENNPQCVIGYTLLNEGSYRLEPGLFVPLGIKLPELYTAAKTRINGRVPTLVYTDPKTTTQIWRSSYLSKPLEKLIESEQDTNTKFMQAMAKPTGKLTIYCKWTDKNESGYVQQGYISESQNWLQHKTYKILRYSSQSSYDPYGYRDLWKRCSQMNTKEFTHDFIKSEWPVKIEQTLRYATEILQDLKTSSVLITCEDGSQSSCVLSSIVQILLDPFYRTFEGIRNLISKDWVFFNHNFSLKNRHDRFVPHFIRFLDCVYQLQIMNPTHFEYNAEYLAYIGYSTFSNKYYEFTLPSSIKTKDNQDQKRFQTQLISALSFQEDRNIKSYNNLEYSNPDKNLDRMIVDTTMIKLWKEFFGRYGNIEERIVKLPQDIAKDRRDHGHSHQESIEIKQLDTDGVDKRDLAKLITELQFEMRQNYTKIEKMRNDPNLNGDQFEMIKKIDEQKKIISKSDLWTQ